MPTQIDLTGQRYGRWTVIERGFTVNSRTAWICVCDCGTRKTVRTDSLRSGRSPSCGCLSVENAGVMGRRNIRHAMRGTPEYRSWCAMRQRCRDPRHQAWHNYGGRGITICDRWDDFTVFLADMGSRPPETSLDRVDCDGNYEPSNCRWATASEQRCNQRSLKPAAT